MSPSRQRGARGRGPQAGEPAGHDTAAQRRNRSKPVCGLSSGKQESREESRDRVTWRVGRAR